MAALFLWANGDPAPWVSAASWWTVYGSISDVLCLLALVCALRFEARQLRDLVVLGAGGLKAQLTAVPLYLLALLVWGGQHVVIPFIADGTYLLARLLTALVVALGMTVVFVLLRRRLVTTTLIHWAADAPTALLPLAFAAAS